MKAFMLAAMSLLASTTAWAKDSSNGCGLGWKVTKNMTMSASTTRGSTNATFSSPFAMTSGTSGCAKHSILRNEKRRIHFIESSSELLASEAARGGGEFSDALARLMGCDDASFKSFSEALRAHRREIFDDGRADASSILTRVEGVVHGRRELSSCAGA